MKRRKNPALPEPAARLLAQDRERIEAEEAARASSCAVAEARKAAAAAARACKAAGRRRVAERVKARRVQIRAEWPRKAEKRAAGRAKLSRAQVAQRSRAGLRTSEERERLLDDAAGYLDEPGDRDAFLWWARPVVATQPGWTADRYQQLAERFNESRDVRIRAWLDRVEAGPDPEWEAGVLWEIARDLEDVHPDELSGILAGYQVDDAPDLRRTLEELGVDVSKQLRRARAMASKKKITKRANPKRRAPKKAAAKRPTVKRRKNPAGLVERLKARLRKAEAPKAESWGAGFLATRGPAARAAAKRTFPLLRREAADLDATARAIQRLRDRLLDADADRTSTGSRLERAARLAFEAAQLIMEWEFDAFGGDSEEGAGRAPRARGN